MTTEIKKTTKYKLIFLYKIKSFKQLGKSWLSIEYLVKKFFVERKYITLLW